MRTTLPILGVILAGALGLAPVVFADQANDAAIRARVEKEFQAEDLTNGTGPFIQVKDGLVTLTGLTKNLYAKNKSVAAAMKVAGVNAVEDRLEVPKGESDKKVAEEIRKAVLRYPFFTIYDDVNMTVDNGNVTLIGDVTMPFKADEISKQVSKVVGVQSIKNELDTLPTNTNDERLRVALTWRIYGSPQFYDYAYRVNPPIHIIVKHGHVVLSGAVRSNVEKRQAEIIARSTFGVFSVKNKLVVAG